jgi:hypothetical protein
MTHVIRISDQTFAKLQLLAQPLVDTPESVIDRVLDNALASTKAINGKNEFTVTQPAPVNKQRVVASFSGLEINPESPDNLTHTRVRYARFGDHEVKQPNWNEVMRMAHSIALESLGSFEALRMATSANMKKGAYTGEGFSAIHEAGISIQGADANKAWQHSLRLAKKIGTSIEVQFEWYSKPVAAHPGKQGRLQWAP